MRAVLAAVIAAFMSAGAAHAVAQVRYPPSQIAAVSGTFGATGQSAAFRPIPGPMFNVTISGTFSATVQLERSFNGGSTWHPLTAGGVSIYSWTAPASEQFEDDESDVMYRLNCTAYTSGTATYRISQ